MHKSLRPRLLVACDSQDFLLPAQTSFETAVEVSWNDALSPTKDMHVHFAYPIASGDLSPIEYTDDQAAFQGHRGEFTTMEDKDVCEAHLGAGESRSATEVLNDQVTRQGISALDSDPTMRAHLSKARMGRHECISEANSGDPRDSMKSNKLATEMWVEKYMAAWIGMFCVAWE